MAVLRAGTFGACALLHDSAASIFSCRFDTAHSIGPRSAVLGACDLAVCIALRLSDAAPPARAGLSNSLSNGIRIRLDCDCLSFTFPRLAPGRPDAYFCPAGDKPGHAARARSRFEFECAPVAARFARHLLRSVLRASPEKSHNERRDLVLDAAHTRIHAACKAPRGFRSVRGCGSRIRRLRGSV